METRRVLPKHKERGRITDEQLRYVADYLGIELGTTFSIKIEANPQGPLVTLTKVGA